MSVLNYDGSKRAANCPKCDLQQKELDEKMNEYS